MYLRASYLRIRMSFRKTNLRYQLVERLIATEFAWFVSCDMSRKRSRNMKRRVHERRRFLAGIVRWRVLQMPRDSWQCPAGRG